MNATHDRFVKARDGVLYPRAGSARRGLLPGRPAIGSRDADKSLYCDAGVAAAFAARDPAISWSLHPGEGRVA